MSNILPYILALILVAIIIIWIRPNLRDMLRESLFRNSEVRYRNIIGLLLGFVAAMLLLSSGALSSWGASWWFVGALVATMVLFIVVRANEELPVDRFAWGLLPVIVLGFGSGALIYQTRSWWIWLWNKYRLINEPHELVLEFLFLLGVILGVFVVRNWSKEQEAFTKSLSGLLGGTFIAGIFGESMEGQGLTTIGALTYYGLGFVISASLNLLVAARLTANYTNKRSISSRALLDFLYGSERTKLIDGYFLQNFKDDPDYAKRALAEALVECSKLVQREFAERLELRRARRLEERAVFPKSPEVQAVRTRLAELEVEYKAVRIASEHGLVDGGPILEQIYSETEQQRSIVKQLQRDTKPSFFYELIAIECEEKDAQAITKSPPVAETDPNYTIVYKHVGGSSAFAPKVDEKMFRVGVSARWQETLEYITSPGEYREPFPYQNSVAGLALEIHQTIVMERDSHKRFRNKRHTDGICPKDVEQNRGLKEIDYLSYIAIPIVSRPGSPGENAVGVVTIDTKLFVSRSKLEGDPIKASEGIFRVQLKRSKLREYATNLYDHDDKDVKYIEDLTKIITPVLELHSKCRVGAT